MPARTVFLGGTASWWAPSLPGTEFLSPHWYGDRLAVVGELCDPTCPGQAPGWGWVNAALGAGEMGPWTPWGSAGRSWGAGGASPVPRRALDQCWLCGVTPTLLLIKAPASSNGAE